jgi:uncharacterized protein (TIGR01777 family)
MSVGYFVTYVTMLYPFRFPSLEKRGGGDFINHTSSLLYRKSFILKIPLHPFAKVGDEKEEEESYSVLFCYNCWMKVLVCGGTGFIGQRLSYYLLNQGFEVVVLARHKPTSVFPGMQFYEADLLKPELFKHEWFEEVDAVVNLSGKNIFTFWSEENKKVIWDSRVVVNKNLVNFISKLKCKPKVFVSASAVGYYGDKEETEIDEGGLRGEGFLSELCDAWEKEGRGAEQIGIRSVQVRTAPVLAKGGGLMEQIMKSFGFGFTFVFGSGKQWFPWIHRDDLIRIYHSAITDENLSGPINACSPHPVRFREFLNHLRAFKQALVIPIPVRILRIFLRETADVFLFSQKMVPSKLLKNNFQFSYPDLMDALEEIFS